MPKTVIVQGQKFTFKDNVTDEQISSVIDGLFGDIKKKGSSGSVGERVDTTGSISGQPKENGILSDLQFDKKTYTPQPTGPESVRSNYVEKKATAPQLPMPSADAFDPAKFVAQKLPLIQDSQNLDVSESETTKVFKEGFGEYYKTVDRAINSGLVKDEKEFNKKFPEAKELYFDNNLYFDDNKTEFIESYDGFSDEIKQYLEPAIIRKDVCC